MQRLLEQKTPLLKYQSASATHHRMHMPIVLLCIGLAAYIALFLLPYAATDDLPEGRPADSNVALVPPLSKIRLTQQPHAGSSVDSSSNSAASGLLNSESLQGAKSAAGLSSVSLVQSPSALRPGEVPSLHPWGYNKDRNLARWKALYVSIAADARQRFTLIDYGADQGYFSISVAKFFPDAFVMGLEMGGCGGEIWKKHCDVLLIQEQQLLQRRVTNMRICQAKMHQKQFAALAKASMTHDYQFVLSVFHWFDLKSRDEFEVALVDLLRNAKTTFIELPTIGDDGPIIRKQVNYESFKKWYDGRTNIGEIIKQAADRHSLQVNTTLLVSLPWAQKYTRDVYRVDQLALGGVSTAVERSSFRCRERREIYGCNTARAKFNECPDDMK